MFALHGDILFMTYTLKFTFLFKFTWFNKFSQDGSALVLVACSTNADTYVYWCCTVRAMQNSLGARTHSS